MLQQKGKGKSRGDESITLCKRTTGKKKDFL